nr:hypothetical protein [Tanacetum cinerariifolium]
LEKRLLESCGCLLLVCRDDIGSKEFTIYEMMKGCSVWMSGKLTLMVRNPYVWPAPINKMAGTPRGEMADQIVVGVFTTRIMRLLPLVTRVVEVLKRVTLLLWSLLLLLLTCYEADNTNADANPCKVLHVDDSTIVARGSRPKPSAAGGSKLDPSISKAKFRLLFLENLCEDVYVSIPRKVVEMNNDEFQRVFLLSIQNFKRFGGCS